MKILTDDQRSSMRSSKISPSEKMADIYILCDNDEYKEKSIGLSDILGVRCVYDNVKTGPESLILQYGSDGLSLTGDGMTLRADFSDMTDRLRPDRVKGEMINKAVGLKYLKDDPLIMDATAGFGEDSILMAAAGFRVVMFERNMIIAMLLKDALIRAQKVEELSDITTRLQLRCGDSIEAMNDKLIQPDVIYLDPMFPQRNKSGLIKKKFQLLQKLENPCDEEEDLFDAACRLNPSKIIVKRPLKGNVLASRKPGYCIKGSTVRYDCYVL
ncbi:MAG: class I SAM-dependent methyltransferase [Lachnospiraceae bacterium]|nr:class I SAM-dependent methyltransferase [Lachnospiraceae bacterium]